MRRVQQWGPTQRQAEGDGFKAPAFRPLRKFLKAGLAHEPLCCLFWCEKRISLVRRYPSYEISANDVLRQQAGSSDVAIRYTL